jgi:hypothetical protein
MLILEIMDKDCVAMAKMFEDLYINQIIAQRGGGMGDYFAEYTPESQEGASLGSFFRGLFRAIIPLAKPALKSLGKHAFTTAIGTVGDIAHGEDWRVAAKRRMNEAGENIIGQVGTKVQQMTGSGFDINDLSEFSELRNSNYGNISEDEDYNGSTAKNARKLLFSLNPPPGVKGCAAVKNRQRNAPSGVSKCKKPLSKKKKVKKPKKKQIKKKRIVKHKKPTKKNKRKQFGNGYDFWLG